MRSNNLKRHKQTHKDLLSLPDNEIKNETNAFMKKISIISQEQQVITWGPFWYAHEADMLRLLIMYIYGGTYFDTDVILMQKMDNLLFLFVCLLRLIKGHFTRQHHFGFEAAA